MFAVVSAGPGAAVGAIDGAATGYGGFSGQNISLGLGILAVAVGVVSIALVATGVGAPVGLAIAGLALGAVGTAIDCHAAFDLSCQDGIAGTALRFGGLRAAGKAADLGWDATLPLRNSATADNVANVGVMLEMGSAAVGTAGAGASLVSRTTGADW